MDAVTVYIDGGIWPAEEFDRKALQSWSRWLVDPRIKKIAIHHANCSGVDFDTKTGQAVVHLPKRLKLPKTPGNGKENRALVNLPESSDEPTKDLFNLEEVCNILSANKLASYV
ncbi:MAG: hypothetical protein ACREGH_00795 [Minisyncoccia bacterium]